MGQVHHRTFGKYSHLQYVHFLHLLGCAKQVYQGAANSHRSQHIPTQLHHLPREFIATFFGKPVATPANPLYPGKTHSIRYMICHDFSRTTDVEFLFVVDLRFNNISPTRLIYQISDSIFQGEHPGDASWNHPAPGTNPQGQ